MSTEAVVRVFDAANVTTQQFAKHVLRQEAAAILALANRLDGAFDRAVELILSCRGNVIVTGIGKAGLIGQKLMATFASTGTYSHFLHPAEAFHGDLGRLRDDDVVLAFSYSGQTEEVLRMLPLIQEKQLPLIAVTKDSRNALALASRVVLPIGDVTEACGLGLAPSTSTTAMLALGDALALAVSRAKDFQARDFARFHPGGSLGRRLARVEDLMRPLSECRVARDDETVRAVFVSASRPGRRTGAIMLTDGDGKLTGLFTDSDLARLLECTRDHDFDTSVRELMNQNPVQVVQGTLVQDAMQLVASRKISELPVVDAAKRPVGILDITDLVGLTDSTEKEVQVEPHESAPERATLPFQKNESE